ncbi:MAG: AmmeMemoRadiSam system protein B [Planctomycetaceae bacterium]|jgi:AmmeMemoRadiSam system protein B/AmmeMemoRadiSam system protein A|nr:AmmeMemoRadiSam system protein B [Planctomycetaceae bacterium]
MGPKEKIEFTEMEEALIFHTAAKRVAANVLKKPLERVRDTLGKLAATQVLGVFVSLKRHGELRSCMGCLAEALSLSEAVETSADRAACDDPRFPPISPIELETLDMEVWVLWGMSEVEQTGKDRLNVVEIGKHGLQIQRGTHRGLLLPGVAVEHHMNAEQFLEAVCRKAGLPTEAWHNAESKLSVFEGKAIHGPLSLALFKSKSSAKNAARRHGPTLTDVIGLREAARSNFFKYLDGATPHYYQPQFYDGNVNGIALAVTLPDASPIVCAEHELKPSIPLQTTLLKFSHVLGEQVKRIGSPPQDLLASQFTLTVHWDMAIHGPSNDCDISPLDTAQRSLMLSTKDGWVILFDPSADPEDIFDEACEILGVDDSTEGMIYSFETVSTMSRFELTSFPNDPVYPSLRPATLAGSFYPATAKSMETELHRMFQGTERNTPESYAAALVPHAGWMYSGRLAAETLSHIKIPDSVMIFAPKHRPGGSDWAAAPFQIWGIPFGNVAGDQELMSDFAHSVRNFMIDPIPHKQEHAIEVQLPLLRKLKPDVKIVGVTMSGGEWEELHTAASQFAVFLERLENPPLLLISSDMNHYAAEELTYKLDRMVLDAIATLSPEKLFEVVTTNRISMCGIHAAVFVLEALRLSHRLHEVIEVGHTTSAAVSGDTSRVVGYAGLLFR